MSTGETALQLPVGAEAITIGYRSPMLGREPDPLDDAGKMALARECGLGVVEPQCAPHEISEESVAAELAAAARSPSRPTTDPSSTPPKACCACSMRSMVCWPIAMPAISTSAAAIRSLRWRSWPDASAAAISRMALPLWRLDRGAGGQRRAGLAGIFSAMRAHGVACPMHIEHCTRAEQVRSATEHIRGVVQGLTT